MRAVRQGLDRGRDFRWRSFLRNLRHRYIQDEIMDQGGALTFYTFLAIFPFLLFLVTLASRLITPEMTQGLLDELARVAPDPVTEMIGSRVRALRQKGSLGLLFLSLGGALWSSMTAVASLITALNRAYGVKETRRFWPIHGIALLTTFVLGVLVVIAAAITVAVPLVADAIGGRIGEASKVLRFSLSGLIMIVVLSLSYRFLPNVRPRRQVIVPGAVVGVGLWLLTSWGFASYVRNIGTYEILYGALGGVIVLLLWMWLTSQAFLLGAEINSLLMSGRDAHRATPASTRGGVERTRPDPPPRRETGDAVPQRT